MSQLARLQPGAQAPACPAAIPAILFLPWSAAAIRLRLAAWQSATLVRRSGQQVFQGTARSISPGFPKQGRDQLRPGGCCVQGHRAQPGDLEGECRAEALRVHCAGCRPRGWLEPGCCPFEAPPSAGEPRPCTLQRSCLLGERDRRAPPEGDPLAKADLHVADSADPGLCKPPGMPSVPTRLWGPCQGL